MKDSTETGDRRDIIVCIVGESGSGKTSLALHLAEKHGVPTICSYTTRPKRDGEVSGVDHYFVDEWSVPSQAFMLAHTVFGGHEYWTEFDQVRHRVQTYVIDEKGLLDLRRRFSYKYRILAVHVERPDNPTDEKRKDRDRERVELDPWHFNTFITNGHPTLAAFLEDASAQILELIAKHRNGSTD